VIIDLQLNEDLIPKEHFLSYQLNKNGDKNITKFTKTDVGLCHYHVRFIYFIFCNNKLVTY
jgi:hypothetical protein